MYSRKNFTQCRFFTSLLRPTPPPPSHATAAVHRLASTSWFCHASERRLVDILLKFL